MECGRGLEAVINLSKKWLIMDSFSYPSATTVSQKTTQQQQANLHVTETCKLHSSVFWNISAKYHQN